MFGVVAQAGGDLGQTIGEQLPTLPAALNSHQGRGVRESEGSEPVQCSEQRTQGG